MNNDSNSVNETAAACQVASHIERELQTTSSDIHTHIGSGGQRCPGRPSSSVLLPFFLRLLWVALELGHFCSSSLVPPVSVFTVTCSAAAGFLQPPPPADSSPPPVKLLGGNSHTSGVILQNKRSIIPRKTQTNKKQTYHLPSIRYSQVIIINLLSHHHKATRRQD